MAAGAGHIGIQAGTVLQLVPFEGHASADILIPSTQIVGVGASAYVLTGELQQDSGKSVKVALKLFPMMLSEAAQTLLIRELKACREFRHPLLLPFLGTSAFGLHTIIVSYYMANGNLIEYLRRHPSADRPAFVKQVAQAVHYLHDMARYVHGDLKCHNILVSDNGVAVLADFGLSTTVDDRFDEPTTITSIRQQNSLRFAAPEILFEAESKSEDIEEPDGTRSRARRRSKTRESDVYAFGMVVLEIFTGEMPWVGLGTMAVIVQVSQANVPPRPEIGKWGFTQHYWEMCLHCWSYYPKQRPPMSAIVNKLSQSDDASGSYGPVYQPTPPPAIAADIEPDAFTGFFHNDGNRGTLGIQLGEPAATETNREERNHEGPFKFATVFTPPSPLSSEPDNYVFQPFGIEGRQLPSPTPAEYNGSEDRDTPIGSRRASLELRGAQTGRLSHRSRRSSVASQTENVD